MGAGKHVHEVIHTKSLTEISPVASICSVTCFCKYATAGHATLKYSDKTDNYVGKYEAELLNVNTFALLFKSVSRPTSVIHLENWGCQCVCFGLYRERSKLSY